MTTIKNSAIALLVIVLFANNSFASVVTNPIPTAIITEDPLTVKYMGEEDGYLFFQVSLNAAVETKASLSVIDKNEGEIYNASLSNNKTQTLKIEKRDNQELSFDLQIGKISYSKSFIVVPTVVLSKL